MKLIVFVLSIVINCCVIAKIKAQCLVELPEDKSIRPTFYKKVGTRTAQISNETPFVEIQEGEEISAHCSTRFVEPAFVKNKPTVDLKCVQNQINLYYNRIKLSCDPLKWNLYESTTPFKWCPPPTVSYILARPSTNAYEYLAAICYNFEEMSVVSLHYAMAAQFSKYLYPLRLRNYTPSVEINNIPISFVSRNITVSLYDNPQFQEWIEFANYQNFSLIQNPKLYHDDYDQFGGLLDVAWWPSLRLGNWRLYEKALGKHIQADSHEYDILAGTSGTVSVPIYATTCQKTRSLVELADKTNRKIPLYIWQYLKSTRNDSNDIVIIGVNSPFVEFYDKKDLVFCTDICAKIEWLANVFTTFDHKNMGIIFCCSVDEVKNSKRLYGFPLSQKPSKSLPPPLPFLRANPLSVLHLNPVYDDTFDETTVRNETEEDIADENLIYNDNF